MLPFVKSIPIKKSLNIKELSNRDASFGYVLDVKHCTANSLFETEAITYVTFKDVVHDCIVTDVIIEPKWLATIEYADIKGYEFKLKYDMEMNATNILKSLVRIRNEYDLNYQQSEFLLLSFYMINGDQIAYSTHIMWREYTDKKENVQEVFNPNDRTSIDLLPYLDDNDRKGLLDSGFFEDLNDTTFKLNKKKFNTDIFINKNVAYNQLTDVFQGCVTMVNNHSYKVCNVTDRKKSVDEYWDSIDGQIDRHLEILKACEYAIDNDLITTGLNKIIANTEYNDWVLLLNDTGDDSEESINEVNIVC